MTTVAPQPGTYLLGKYRVERVIGSGGMGVVVEATHVALGQSVAVKLLNSELARSGEIVARFLREARIAAKLETDHIPRVTDVGQTEAGTPYIVMELLAGHDLATEIERRGPLPVRYAVDTILQACEGLAEAHSVGLVHRDLKPANLFLAARPNRPSTVKVLDFGLSKEAPDSGAASLTQPDSVFGTPQYMSPEQLRSTKNVDARSDQHALGMILYEMLAGHPPWRAENVTHLVVVIATAPPPRVRQVRRDVPAKLEQALLRALAKQPEERFADLADFADAIAPFGGPQAKSMAKEVRAALLPRDRASFVPSPRPGNAWGLRADEPRFAPKPPGRPAHINAASDELITTPFAGAAASDDARLSSTGLTSSLAVLRRGRRTQRLLVGGSIAGLAAAIGVALALVPGGAPDEAASASPGGERAAGASAPAATSVVMAAGPEPSVSAVSTAAPAAHEASPPASAGKRQKTGTAGASKPPAPKPAVSSLLGAFGERK